MAKVTVEQLAKVVGISVERLLTQLKSAGIEVTSADQTLDDKQKQILLEYLKSGKKEEGERQKPKKITLKRKSAAEGAAKSTNTISVTTVRRKRHAIDSEFEKAQTIEQAYNLAYIYANDVLQGKLEGTDQQVEENFLEKVVDGIKYFATLNDDRIKLVQFTQKGYYVLDFKRLDSLYNNDKLDLSSRYSTGSSGDEGITIPKVSIYDKISGKDLMTIRMFRNAAGYIRNYIEKEALLVQLTKVRGTK